MRGSPGTTGHHRARFPLGCRVTLDVPALGAAHGTLAPPYTGTVVGYSRYFAELGIQLDGRKSPQKFQIPSDLVVKSQATDIIDFIYSSSGAKTASTGHAAT